MFSSNKGNVGRPIKCKSKPERRKQYDTMRDFLNEIALSEVEQSLESISVHQQETAGNFNDYSENRKKPVPAFDLLNHLSSEFLTAFENCSFSDVSFKCDEEILQAHKFVLSARSPVFKAMFSTPMEEDETNTVAINDMSVPTLRDLLSFIYGAEVRHLSLSKAFDLLYAAEKYQVQGLKYVCIEKMVDCLTAENALEILQHADLYDKGLKSVTLDFIARRFTVLKSSEEWKKLQSDQPFLAIEVLSKVVDL